MFLSLYTTKLEDLNNWTKVNVEIKKKAEKALCDICNIHWIISTYLHTKSVAKTIYGGKKKKEQNFIVLSVKAEIFFDLKHCQSEKEKPKKSGKTK